MSRLHPDTRKFAARFAISDDRAITDDHEKAIKEKIEQSIVEAMDQEGYRPINAVLHTRERVPFPNEDSPFYMIEYRAIRLGLPHGVQP
jgi:hypothetical protein